MSIEPGQSAVSQGLTPSVHTKTEDNFSTQHPSGIVPQLQNVVATCYLGRKLDLKHIAMHARNAEYNPKRFAAVIMRIREPKTTALVFSSGKMVCTGAKSEQDVRLASRKFARIIQKLGFEDAKFRDFKVQNIVGSCDVLFPIRLEGLHYKHSLFSSYEPELFPGLIYRMKVPKVVLLIFVSGKVVLTGAKTREEIYTAFETIHPALVEFRKGDSASMPPGLDTLTGSTKRSTTLREEPSELKTLHSIMSNINSLHSVDQMSNARLVRNLAGGNFQDDVTGDRKRARLDTDFSNAAPAGRIASGGGMSRVESADVSHLFGTSSLDYHHSGDWKTQVPPSTPRLRHPTSSP